MVVPADPSKEFKMTRWIAFALLPVMGALFDAPPGHAQAAAKRPAFEVASIKPDKDCDPRKDGGSNSPGRLNLVCRTPRQDIELAYADLDGPHERWPRLEGFGGPHWLDTDQYDIFAKAEGPAPYLADGEPHAPIAPRTTIQPEVAYGVSHYLQVRFDRSEKRPPIEAYAGRRVHRPGF